MFSLYISLFIQIMIIVSINVCFFKFLCFAATQLAHQLQQKRTQKNVLGREFLHCLMLFNVTFAAVFVALFYLPDIGESLRSRGFLVSTDLR
jgi:hypothetical protein